VANDEQHGQRPAPSSPAGRDSARQPAESSATDHGQLVPASSAKIEPRGVGTVVRRDDRSGGPARVVGVRLGVVIVLLVVIIVLATAVVVLWLTRLPADEAGTKPSATTTPTQTSTTVKPTTAPSSRPASTTPSSSPTVSRTASGGAAAPSWSGQVVLTSGGDLSGLSIHVLPPKYSELNGNISVGLMDDEQQVDRLSLANGTMAARLDAPPTGTGFDDCRQLLQHNISGSFLNVHVGDRVCFQNQDGDIGLMTVKSRHPEGQFALATDLIIWQHPS
jgi:hypothetical protein